MRTLRKSTIAGVLLVLATGGALAQSQGGRGHAAHGPGAQFHGGGQVHGRPGPAQVPPSLRPDGRFMHDGQFANDPRIAGHRFGPDGRFSHDGLVHHGRVHGGHFVHGFHGGHVGWWLVANGVWYPWPQYAAAVPVYVAPAYTNVWYYCRSADGYYPLITDCPEGWLAVVPSPTAG